MTKKLIAACLLTISFASAQTLTPEILMQFKRVSEPRISPDGKKVLYNVRTMDVAANKGNNDVYLMDVNGSNAVAIANGAQNETGARWSDDGSKVFYMDDADGTSQVWMMNADGTGKSKVTDIASGISNFGINFKSNTIWFTADVKLEKNPAELYPDLPKTENARIIDGLMYRHWNAWEDYAYSHLFIVKFNNGKTEGKPVDIMPNEKFDTPLAPDGGEEQISFSADGNKIAYTCKKLFGTEYAVSTNSDIYVYDITSGQTQNVSKGMMGYDMVPRFSPDGTKMIWFSMETPGYEADRIRMMQYDFATGVCKELLSNFDYNVEKAEYNTAGNMIYFTVNYEATVQLYSYDLNPKAKTPLRKITNVTADIQDFSFSANTKESVMIVSMMHHFMPTEIFTVDLKTGTVNQVSKVNTDLLSKLKMGTEEKRWITTTDGKKMLVWVVLPPGFDKTKKYPTLLYCQGGPQSTVSQFFSYRWNFAIMAAKGYIVVAPNRRGLPGFGQEWNRQISGDWGGQNMKDYLAAIDSLSKEPYVDKTKLGAVGASYGGYSVYWLAGNHQKRFKAFIAHCGVFDLKSMYGMTEEIWFPHFDLGGAPWDKPTPKSYTQFSPVDFVQNWDTPILVIHNEKDFRVPLAQGMEAFSAAQLKGVPSRFLYFPDEGHWVGKPQNAILWQRVFFEWLDKYLK